MKKVYKFATGVKIPDGAIYLSTQVEKHILKEKRLDFRGDKTDDWNIIEVNKYVWHYFLVELVEMPPQKEERND